MNSLRERLNNSVSDPLEQMGTLADMLEFGPVTLTGLAETLSAAEFVEVLMNPAGDAVLNLPAVEDMNGRKVWVKNLSVNKVTLTPAGAETIDGAATLDLAAASQYDYVCLGSDGVVWHVVYSS